MFLPIQLTSLMCPSGSRSNGLKHEANLWYHMQVDGHFFSASSRLPKCVGVIRDIFCMSLAVFPWLWGLCKTQIWQWKTDETAKLGKKKSQTWLKVFDAEWLRGLPQQHHGHISRGDRGFTYPVKWQLRLMIGRKRGQDVFYTREKYNNNLEQRNNFSQQTSKSLTPFNGSNCTLLKY